MYICILLFALYYSPSVYFSYFLQPTIWEQLILLKDNNCNVFYRHEVYFLAVIGCIQVFLSYLEFVFLFVSLYCLQLHDINTVSTEIA